MAETPVNQFEHGINVACNLPRDGTLQLVAELEADGGTDGIVGYTVRDDLIQAVPDLSEMTTSETAKRELVWDPRSSQDGQVNMGPECVDVALAAGVNALMIFPSADPTSQRRWKDIVIEAQSQGLKPIVSPQSGDLYPSKPNTLLRILMEAKDLGVSSFGVRGDDADIPLMYQRYLSQRRGMGEATLYARRLIIRNQQPYALERLTGRWVAVVGSIMCRKAISEARETATTLASVLLAAHTQKSESQTV